MPYVPLNLNVYTAAFAGAMAAIANPIGAAITDPTPANYATQANIADTWAQAVDTIWGAVTPADSYAIECIQSLSMVFHAGHATSKSINWTTIATAVVTAVQKGQAIIAAQGITPTPAYIGWPPYRNLVFGTVTKNLGIVELGAVPLGALTTGTNNTVFGVGAGASIQTAIKNVAIGDRALAALVENVGDPDQRTYCVAIGSGALEHNTGKWNTACGHEAMTSNTTGVQNAAFGVHALEFNTTGNANTACGLDALLLNTTGSGNTGVGLNAGRQNTTGNNNTSVGQDAANWNLTGSNNTAIGYYAGVASLSDGNTSIGCLARSNAAGTLNVAVGYNCNSSASTGSYGVAIGVNALAAATSGDSNVAIGYRALAGSTSGYLNTAIGQSAGLTITTELANTCLGAQADINAGIVNATALGYQAKVTSNNTIQCGRSDVKTFRVGPWSLYQLAATPENAQNGNIGDLAIDTTGGAAYLKVTGAGTNTGWKEITHA